MDDVRTGCEIMGVDGGRVACEHVRTDCGVERGEDEAQASDVGGRDEELEFANEDFSEGWVGGDVLGEICSSNIIGCSVWEIGSESRNGGIQLRG